MTKHRRSTHSDTGEDSARRHVSKARESSFVVPHGSPTCLLVVNDCVWVGTDRGTVVIYAAKATRARARSNDGAELRGRELSSAYEKQPVYQLTRIKDSVVSIAKSPQINVWALDGALLHTLDSRHEFSVMALCVVGDYFVTAGWDKSMRLWSADAYEHKAEVPHAHDDMITSLAFVPESSDACVWSGSWDRNVKMWSFGV